MVAMALRRLIGRVIFWPDIARPPDVTAFFIGLTAGYAQSGASTNNSGGRISARRFVTDFEAGFYLR
jgi:hypothetical protein